MMNPSRCLPLAIKGARRGGIAARHGKKIVIAGLASASGGNADGIIKLFEWTRRRDTG